MTVPRPRRDVVHETRDWLIAEVAGCTGLSPAEVGDLRWCDVDTDRRVLELDGEEAQTVLPLSPQLASLLYWRGCWQRHRYSQVGQRWSPFVRVFDDEPVAA